MSHRLHGVYPPARVRVLRRVRNVHEDEGGSWRAQPVQYMHMHMCMYETGELHDSARATGL